MKNYMKVVVTFVFLMAAVMFVPTISEAEVGVPVGLKQIDASSESVKFSWDAVIGAKNYCVSYGDGINWSNPEKVYGSTNKYITGLSAGKSYYVKVAALESDDTPGAFSAELEVVTAPNVAEMNPINIVEKTDTSITLSWAAASGATSYELKDVVYQTGTYLIETAVPTATVAGLAPETWYGIDVFAVRTSLTGYRAYSARLHNYIQTAPGAASAPNTPTTSNFAITNPSTSGIVNFYAADPNKKANGYELEVYKVKGNKKVKSISSTSSYISNQKFSKNTPYKYRIRFFAVSGTTKLYSGWSGFRYFWIHNITGKKSYKLSSSYCTINLKWSKVEGATGYTVYISTSKDGKYKKVKSFGKNARSIKITKYGKSNLNRYTTYYMKIVANVKSGKTTLKNDAQIINYNY